MSILRRSLNCKKGSILIYSLWILALLGIFAAQIGLRVRQRAALLSKIESRSQLHHIAEGGLKKAIAALRSDIQLAHGMYTALSKYNRHNNQNLFNGITIGQGKADVKYQYYNDASNQYEDRFGFVDEERKLNVNVAGVKILKRLIRNVAVDNEDEAQEIAEAIIDWRELGQSRLTGFYSDDYYANLEFPYEPKNADFELIDELKLIHGVTQEVFERLRPFITVYGDGKININTASFDVLLALGLEKTVVDKLLYARRGFDGVEATEDDYVFRKPYDVASEIKSFVEMDLMEIKQIDQLNKQGMIKTNSFYYTFEARAQLNNRKEQLTAVCTYDVLENKIVDWKESSLLR